MFNNISVTSTGLIDINNPQRYTQKQVDIIMQSASKALNRESMVLKKAIISDAKSKFKIKQKRFLSSVKYNVENKDKSRLPGLHFRSGIPWMGAHEFGTIINKKVLIPITNKKRVSPSFFKNLIKALLQTQNAFFKVVNSKTILFANPTALPSDYLTKYGIVTKYKKIIGSKKKPQLQWVPIALLISNVKLQGGRIDIVKRVNNNIFKFADAIVAEITKNLNT